MLILDRTQRAWATLSAVVCVVAGGVYACYASWSANGPTGGSVLGLIFGSIAAAMMVFAGLLAARRRFPAARVGSAQFWMKGHLWIGTLTVPFALFHAGFGLGGRVEILLWVLFFAVILSGFWGLLLQQLLPRMMFENLPRETFIEQIPHLCIRFTAESDRLLSEVCGPLEVTLTPGEVQQFEPHLRPHFKDHFGKNRSLYPNTETDAVHFQKYLKRIYVEIPTPAAVTATEAPQPVIAHQAPPAMKSVAQIKAPEQPTVTPPAVTPVIASAAEAPALKPKPDPKALLAAAKAKSAGAVLPATAASAPEVAAVESDSAPAVSPAVQAKPDPQAILAAARAKKAAAEATEAPADPVASPVDVPVAAVATKPDPKAMLAAAKAKRDAAAAGTGPTAPTAEPSPAAEPAPPSEPPSAPAPAGKPDAKAMLAAMKAKKEAAAQQAGSVAAPAEPAPAPQANPLGPLKTVKQPAATPQPDLVAAANLAPPTPAQVKELKLFYLELIRPQLPLQPATQAWRESIHRSIMVCQIRSDNQHPQFIPIFDQLLDLCEQRRQFAMIQRYHFWLHGWLLVHIPATVALYLVLIVHAVVALRVVPFGN